MRQSGHIRWGQLKVGSVILVAFVIFLWAAFRVPGPKMFARTHTCRVYFSDVAGILAGNPVRMSGVPIGTVLKVSFDEYAKRQKVELVINKRQIMSDYLSAITTGLNRYGVTAAACAYFHAPIRNLTLGQYALLAGVTQAPSLYDPTVDPDAATSRRGHVLAAMVSDRMISKEQAAAAAAEPVLVGAGPGC